MAEFQLQEYMEEFERVFPDMKDKRGTPDYMKELQDYFEGLASKQSEGIGDMAMKSGLIDEYRNYKMGQEDAGQPFMSPRELLQITEQASILGIKVMMAINKFANPPQTIQDYMEDETDTTTGIHRSQAADYFENINKPPAPPTGGDGQDFISPNMAQIAGPTTTDLNVAEDVTGDENTFELRPDDFVSRFSIPDQFRQKAAFGGIMGLDGRRAYGLGSRLKRAFKKLTKSKIGKIALAYLIGTGLGSFTKSAAAAGTGSGFSRFKPQNLAYLTGYQGKDLVKIKQKHLQGLNKINLAESENILSKVAADKAR